MSRGTGKYRPRGSYHNTSFQFDNLCKENSNKPTAARSTGTVGKWGITSFTSIRAANGSGGVSSGAVGGGGVAGGISRESAHRVAVAEPVVPALPKPKKFFKSRNTEPRVDTITVSVTTAPVSIYQRGASAAATTINLPGDKDSLGGDTDVSVAKKARHSGDSSPPKARAKRFFASKVSKSEKIVLGSSTKANVAPKPPPIVLRICHGKSQLVSDSEDSESTLTPTVTPTTPSSTPTSTNGSVLLSPTNITTSAPPPANARITRSTRRSMQQDYGASPTSGDTVEQSLQALFTSPRNDDLEYIPAETYEEKRKAIYANLLGVDPTNSSAYSIPQPTVAPTKSSPPAQQEIKKEEAVEVLQIEYLNTSDNNNDQPNSEKKHSSPDRTSGHHNEVKEEEMEADEMEIEDSIHPELPSVISVSAVVSKRREAEREVPASNVREASATHSQKSIIELVPMEEEEIAPTPVIETRRMTRSSRPQTVPPFTIRDNTVVKSLTAAASSAPVDVPKPDPVETTMESDSGSSCNSSSFAPAERQESLGSGGSSDGLSVQQRIEASTSSVEEASHSQQTTASSCSIVDENSNGSRSDSAEQKDEMSADKAVHIPKENPSPVKLVISKKKGSIFKSRALGGSDESSAGGRSKRRAALYRHKWCSDDANKPSSGSSASKTGRRGDDGAEHAESAGGDSSPGGDESGTPGNSFQDNPLSRVVLKGVASSSAASVFDDIGEVATVKCSKNDKGYYTVVRNVKKAHQMQEIGEFQEFNDDVDYILDTLQDNNPISTRCLSAISLASKCMAPAFRMHVRAHGTVAKFFKALHDSTRDQSLGLCTATVMFVLSQDRLNMDLDRDCLELMLNLLESDVTYSQALDVCGLSSAQLEKNKQKVRELCAEIQSHGHAMHLNLDNITVGQLAMETLLSLTSKRAGEWFKEELRELGGLEHIMNTICDCCRQVSDYVVAWTDALLDKLRKVDRCLRVLENVTHNNEENQSYLLKFNNGVLLDTLVSLYRLCDSEIPLYPVSEITDKESAGAVIREALLVTLKVLINLTHHFSKRSMGNTLLGQRPGIIDASLHLLLRIPQYIPDQKKFELSVLVLMLLINLIQENPSNKKLLIGAKAPAEGEFQCDKSSVETLIGQFYEWVDYARIAEKRTDAILDGEKDGEASVQPKSNEEFIEETVAKLLQKAGAHMEYTFLASYLVLLMGYLIMDNDEYLATVRLCLKNNNFATMVDLLNKFFNFMNLTASTEASSVCAIKATEKVIKFLERCDHSDRSEIATTSAASSSSYSAYHTDGLDLSFSLTH